MLDRDTTNPFIGEEDAEAVHGLLEHLIFCCAYTGTVDPHLSGSYVSTALAAATTASQDSDVVAVLRGVLFELARYMCLHLPEGIGVQELNSPTDMDPTGKDSRVVVMAAGMEWFKAVAGRQLEVSNNILKALHKEVPVEVLPMAYLNVAAGAVVSLGLSLQASAHHQAHGPECSGHDPE